MKRYIYIYIYIHKSNIMVKLANRFTSDTDKKNTFDPYEILIIKNLRVHQI